MAADNEIVSFAGVYNGGRYPEGVYRILNRTWVAESFRVKDGAFPFLSSKYILPVQLENLQSELKIIFVSREKPSGRLFLKRWRENQPDPSDWVLSEKMIQVVPEVYKRSCFQHICYKKFFEVKWTPVHIEEKAWHELAQSKP